ncbi:MAG TPA: aldo/keto reductase [Xanthobacteraceae bacterium]|nr:aldo/keto reductase [Xanthobacteraceae bacterium]
METVEANGARIPLIGLGTWDLRGRTCVEMVSEALKLGYRQIDTAAAYDNEREVGEGLRASGIKRADVHITTKVWHDSLRAADLERSVEESLKRLGLDQVDLLLIHWPNASVPLKETIGALNKVKRRGLTRHIGVSNFTVELIEEAVKLSAEALATDQIELHVYLDQSKVIAACRRHGLAITAYSPIARGRGEGDKFLTKIGAAHGKTWAQVCLRWLVQQQIIAIPRTSKRERLKENLEVFDFALSPQEMAAISALGNKGGRIVNMAWAPRWD